MSAIDATDTPTSRPDPARRNALQRLGLAALTVSSAGLLAACSSGRRGRVGQPIPPNPGTAPILTDGEPNTSPLTSVDGVVARTQWASYGPNRARADLMRPPEFITVHHDGMSRFDSTDPAETANRLEAIRKSHVGRGWADIGYHYAIDPAGRIWEARPLTLQGAHVRAHNEGNVGIVVLGNFELQRPRAAALESLSTLIAYESARYAIPVSKIMTHREWAPTACPGASLQRAVDRIRDGGVLRTA
ncbi:MAG: peptidoglycan recognition family protein [Planctomycetota bacterium]